MQLKQFHVGDRVMFRGFNPFDRVLVVHAIGNRTIECRWWADRAEEFRTAEFYPNELRLKEPELPPGSFVEVSKVERVLDPEELGAKETTDERIQRETVEDAEQPDTQQIDCGVSGLGI